MVSNFDDREGVCARILLAFELADMFADVVLTRVGKFMLIIKRK